MALLLVALGCEASGQDRLAELPEAELRFPGATQLADGGHDRIEDIFGEAVPTSWTILGIDASLEEVHGFYDAELLELGWERGPGSPSTSETEAFEWDRGGHRLRLGFKDTDEWYQRLEGADQYSTIYEVALIEEDPP